jgi:hypothetical protein
MKKLLCMLAVILVAFLATNCKKDQSNNPPVKGSTEVQFNINSVTQSGLKSNSDEIICSQEKATYVMYKMDGGDYQRVEVFYVGNVPWTNSIKMNAGGTHTLQEFVVYGRNPSTGLDEVIMAAPHSGSTYAPYVTNPLDHQFTVVTDQKLQLTMDVVCFQPTTYTNFGFIYFNLNQIVFRQQWFFGDFCIKNKAEYTGSDYAQQPNWGSGTGYIDAPAIFKIEVYKGTTLMNTFTNDDAAHHFGDKVSVTYGDDLNVTDAFTFKLWILVKQGNAFNFQLFNTWNFYDISNITQLTDGVVDFVLGSCNPTADYIFPPYIDLPNQCFYTINGCGTMGGYVDATLGGIGAGYDIANGLYASNCTDHNALINIGQQYTMNVFSSLYQLDLPIWARSTKWNKINWLYNHLDWFPGYHWYDIQGVIWMYDIQPWTGGDEGCFTGYGITSMMTTMKNAMDLAANHADTYIPSSGGWAAVIFIADLNGPSVQTMMIKIDP